MAIIVDSSSYWTKYGSHDRVPNGHAPRNDVHRSRRVSFFGKQYEELYPKTTSCSGHGCENPLRKDDGADKKSGEGGSRDHTPVAADEEVAEYKDDSARSISVASAKEEKLTNKDVQEKLRIVLDKTAQLESDNDLPIQKLKGTVEDVKEAMDGHHQEWPLVWKESNAESSTFRDGLHKTLKHVRKIAQDNVSKTNFGELTTASEKIRNEINDQIKNPIKKTKEKKPGYQVFLYEYGQFIFCALILGSVAAAVLCMLRGTALCGTPQIPVKRPSPPQPQRKFVKALP